MSSSAGPKSGSTFVSESFDGSQIAWSNPSSAQSSDNSRALTTSGSGTQISEYLKATGFGFTTGDIPSGSIITGILVEWEQASSEAGGGATDYRVRIVKGGSVGSTDRSQTGTWPTTDTYRSYGGSSDLWGESWTVGDITSSGFGAAIAANVSAYNPGGESGEEPRSGLIDHVRITVFFIPPSGHISSSQLV